MVVDGAVTAPVLASSSESSPVKSTKLVKLVAEPVVEAVTDLLGCMVSLTVVNATDSAAVAVTA